MTHPKNSEYQRTFNEKMRAKGYVLKRIWIMPSWWPKVKALIERLNRGRGHQK